MPRMAMVVFIGGESRGVLGRGGGLRARAGAGRNPNWGGHGNWPRPRIGAGMSTGQVDHFSGGKRVNGAGGPAAAAERRPVVNPATGETLAQVEMDSVRAAEAAVEAAAQAFPAWAAKPVGDRVQV